MLVGALIIESLQTGTVLDDVDLTVRRISRGEVADPTPEQPAVWTLVEFAAQDESARRLADQLANVLGGPGWYASFDVEGRVFVVFPGRVFQYDRQDQDTHAEVVKYALAAGVPESQCDW